MNFNELSKHVSKRILHEQELKTLSKAFRSAKPYPHLYIPNFLNPTTAEALRTALVGEKFKEKESDLFSFKQTDDLYFSKNKTIKEFHSFVCTWDFFNLMKSISGIDFSGTLDMSGSLYQSADYLLCHDDKFEGRKLAYILYLSKDFTQKDGGSFTLFNSRNGKPSTIAKKYTPTFNSLLIFEVSPVSFHEVEENVSTKDRYALGGWFH